MRASLLALLVGLLAYAAGYYFGQRGEPTAVPSAGPVVAAPPPVAEAPPPPKPVVIDVAIVGASAHPVGGVSGVVLGAQRRVALPLAALDGAQAVLAETADGRVPIGPVVGVLPAVGLAALSGPEGSLPVASESASLHLGLPVKALERDGAIRGEVESTAMRREDGSYSYRVRLTTPLHAMMAALTDEAGTELIGAITTAGDEDGLYEAVDAGALQALATSETTPVELGDFGERFFSERPEGRLIRFEHAIAASDWTTAIALGRELRDLGWTFSDAVSGPLARAYLEGARGLGAQPDDAIALLDEADATLGDSAERLAERAQLLAQLGRPFAALRAQSAAARLDPSLLPALRRQVLNIALQGALAVEDRMDALASALADDPGYAPYAAALGRLYYAQGRYVEAAANLESALGEDPSLGSDLGGLLMTSRQRLRTPGETIAPLHSSGSSLYVYANVGGRFLRFIVDTGATYTALSARAARSLGIANVADDQQVVLSTANGYLNAPLVTVGSIDVNGAIVQQIPVVLLDDTTPYDGLLGMSFLDHFNVSIDRGAGQMRLVRR